MAKWLQIWRRTCVTHSTRSETITHRFGDCVDGRHRSIIWYIESSQIMEINICVADLGSRGASINRMEGNGWFHSPDWLLDEEKQPEQPNLNCTKEVNVESKPLKEVVFQVAQEEVDEWDWLLERSSYWKTLRVTAWCLRFKHNCLVKVQKLKRVKVPLQTEEIENAKNYCVKRVQGETPEMLDSPGWKFV